MAGISALSLDRRSRPVPSGSDAAFRRRGGAARRRAELEARWRETLERVTALSVAYHEAAASCLPGPPAGSADDAGGPPRAGPCGHEVSQLAQRVVAERQALAEIEAALDRIATGQYGRCEQCRRHISVGMLARQPAARFCASCSRRSAALVAYA